MAINLLELKPNVVSRDLSGYITFIYGPAKCGKTTFGSKMPQALLLAFEPGYKALPGVVAQDITSWGEMKQVLRELKKPEVQGVYKAVIVDTIDIAADRCKKYICQQNGIEDLGDLGYGKGWTKFKEEFNEIFRGLTQLGYAVFFIGHHKESILTDANGVSKTVIRPSLSNSVKEVIAGMADIYGYSHQLNKDEMSVLTLRSTDGSIECGCRFKYIEPQITLSYDNLIRTLTNAIDKEAAEHGGKFVTDEKIPVVAVEKTYDFDAMMVKVQALISDLMTKNQTNAVKITAVIDKYLGKGKKVSECTSSQCEQLELIIQDLEDLV